MSDVWVFDIEGDGLNPTKIHCLAASKNGKNVFVTNSYDDMRKFFAKAKIIVGHNIRRFDIPVVERILGIKITSKVVDTLGLSWYLYPERYQHGLEAWGEDFGIKKPEIDNWETLSIEEYNNRCMEDVKINITLWNQQYEYLFNLYGSNTEVWRIIDYLDFKMYCAHLQEVSQWKVDIENLERSISELENIEQEKLTTLSQAMPKVPKYKIKKKPKKFINSKGDYTVLGQNWIGLLSQQGLPLDWEDDIEIPDGEEDGNPGSTAQIKSWLEKLGWKPETFKYVKNKDTGELRAIPQINLEHGKGICPSIKKLYEVEPNLELLDGLSVIQHRLSILKGFLRDQEDGKIKARINGFTNTLRMKHTTVVNLPKVDKLYAEACRASLIAEDGYVLCGSDMSSLEDRIKKHFLFKHDPEYVRSMDQEDWDPHLEIAIIAGMMTREMANAYKAGDKKSKPIRDVAKNGNYACQYGAGPPRLVLTCGISIEQARKLHEAYWKMNWGIKAVAEEQIVKTVNDQMWLYNPISRLWYSLRYEKDRFSTLVQGTGSWLFDEWLRLILTKRPQLTAQFHDEFIIQIKEGFESQCETLVRDCMKKLNEVVNLNVQLGCDVQFGKRYADIH